MAKPPFFPFFYQDFLTGTRFFTNAQTGAYIRLLLDQWDLGILTQKHFVARMNGISAEECNEIKSKFKSVCVKNVDGFQNERMENVRKDVKKIHKIRSESGKLGGYQTHTKQRSKREANEVANEEAKQKHPNPNPNPNPNLKIKEKIKHTLTSEKEGASVSSLSFWPPDFKFTKERRDYAKQQGIDNPKEVFEDFRLQSLTKNYQYADWDAGWMKWCRSSFQDDKKLGYDKEDENEQN